MDTSAANPVHVEVESHNNPVHIIHGSYEDDKKLGIIQFLQLVLITITGLGFIFTQMDNPPKLTIILVQDSFFLFLLIILSSSIALYTLEGAFLTLGKTMRGTHIKGVDVTRWFYTYIFKISYVLYAIATILFIVSFIYYMNV